MKNNFISIEESRNAKRAYINWLLQNKKFRAREVQWILSYIDSFNLVLDKVHFVTSFYKLGGHAYKRELEISTTDVNNRALNFPSDKSVSVNYNNIFEEVKNNCDEDLYIKVIDGTKGNPMYMSVVEDYDDFDNYFVTNGEQRRATEFLNHVTDEFQRNQIDKRIDQALIDGDREKFMELSAYRKKIGRISKKKGVM